jgi:hypothetical protein
MGTHLEADNSVSVGVKVEAPAKFIAHDIGVACTTSTALPGATAAQTAGATTCSFQNDGASTGVLRYRLDSTAPTSTAGVTVAPGATTLLSIADAINVRFIEGSGFTCTANANYFI